MNKEEREILVIPEINTPYHKRWKSDKVQLDIFFKRNPFIEPIVLVRISTHPNGEEDIDPAQWNWSEREFRYFYYHRTNTWTQVNLSVNPTPQQWCFHILSKELLDDSYKAMIPAYYDILRYLQEYAFAVSKVACIRMESTEKIDGEWNQRRWKTYYTELILNFEGTPQVLVDIVASFIITTDVTGFLEKTTINYTRRFRWIYDYDDGKYYLSSNISMEEWLREKLSLHPHLINEASDIIPADEKLEEYISTFVENYSKKIGGVFNE